MKSPKGITTFILMGLFFIALVFSACKKEEDDNDNEIIPPDNQTGTFTDSRDSKTYNWVKIGDQVWMAENLAYQPRTVNY